MRSDETLIALDAIFAMVELAGTRHARELVASLGGDLRDGVDPVVWVHAIQLARDAMIISPDVAFLLLDIVVENATTVQIEVDELLVAMSLTTRAIEAHEGLEPDDSFFTYDAPSEWLVANRVWDDRFAVLQMGFLIRMGEAGMAAMEASDPDQYAWRRERGRQTLLAFPEERDRSSPELFRSIVWSAMP